ncbi:MAG: twin-arginine translocase TatA/TatE family subunit [Blastocatellia bacterium]
MFLLEDLSLPKILVILAIALLFFGPKRLPELGSSIGTAIRSFKRGVLAEGESASPATEKDS